MTHRGGAMRLRGAMTHRGGAMTYRASAMRLRAVAIVTALALATLPLSACRRRADGSCEHPGGDAWDAVCSALDDSALVESVAVFGDRDGRALTWSRGATATTPFQLASASKWLAAAALMRLVEAGTLQLDDRASAHIDWVTADEADPRSRITLAQLLSFTSGFELRPLVGSCAGTANTTLEACAREFYDEHHSFEPGTTFFYGPPHLHLAAVMAERATDVAWPQIFREEVAVPLGMSDDAGFFDPSVQNPRVSGGARSSTADYERFLLATLRGEFLADSAALMHEDWTPVDEVTIGYSPASDFGEAWHYGLGNWRECPFETWQPACDDTRLVSSIGAFGFHPWIDFDREIYGVLGRKGGLLSSPAQDSARLMNDLRPLLHRALGLD